MTLIPELLRRFRKSCTIFVKTIPFYRKMRYNVKNNGKGAVSFLVTKKGEGCYYAQLASHPGVLQKRLLYSNRDVDK